MGVLSQRSPAQSKTRTRYRPIKAGTMRQDCRRSTLGASHSARLIASAVSVTSTPRSDVAGLPGASRSVEPPCTRAAAAGVLAGGLACWRLARRRLAFQRGGAEFWWHHGAEFRLGHPCRLAPEFLLQVSPHRGFLLLQPSQGALLQRPWVFRGVHHSQRILLAVLMHDFGKNHVF